MSRRRGLLHLFKQDEEEEVQKTMVEVYQSIHHNNTTGMYIFKPDVEYDLCKATFDLDLKIKGASNDTGTNPNYKFTIAEIYKWTRLYNISTVDSDYCDEDGYYHYHVNFEHEITLSNYEEKIYYIDHSYTNMVLSGTVTFEEIK